MALVLEEMAATSSDIFFEAMATYVKTNVITRNPISEFILFVIFLQNDFLKY